MDSFFQKNLASQVDVRDGRWAFRRDASGKMIAATICSALSRTRKRFATSSLPPAPRHRQYRSNLHRLTSTRPSHNTR